MSPSPEPMSPLVLCNHTINLKTDSKTLFYSLLKKNILFLSWSTTKTKRNHKNRVLYKNIFRLIDQWIFASQGTHAMNYLASLAHWYTTILWRQGIIFVISFHNPPPSLLDPGGQLWGETKWGTRERQVSCSLHFNLFENPIFKGKNYRFAI